MLRVTALLRNARLSTALKQHRFEGERIRIRLPVLVRQRWVLVLKLPIRHG